MATEKLLLVVLTDAVRNKAQEYGLGDDELEEELANLDEIKLYYYRTRQDVKEKKDGRLALPFSDGNMVLLLVPDKNNLGTCFVAVDLWDRRANKVSTDDHNAYTLTSSSSLVDRVRCQLLGGSDRAENYQGDALNHKDIFDKVIDLENWKPNQHKSAEEKKWEAYFRICESYLERKRQEFSIYEILIVEGRLLGKLRNISSDESHNIGKKSNDEISFSIAGDSSDSLVLGKLISIRELIIEIGIAEQLDFKKSFLKMLRKAEGFSSEYGNDIVVEFISGKKFSKQMEPEEQEIDFEFSGKPCFRATARLSMEDTAHLTSQGGDEPYDQRRFYINKDTIRPLSLSCAISHQGERSQLRTMRRQFKELKKKGVWNVLSGDRVAKLPEDIEVQFDDPKLNEQQKKAIRGALGAPELFLIWGPPGTGKTQVITEIAKHECKQGKKVLIASQANLAVDNALSRLHGIKEAYPFRLLGKRHIIEGEDKLRMPTTDSSPRFYLDSLEESLRTRLSEAEQYKDIRQKFLEDIEKFRRTLKKQRKLEAEERTFGQFAELYKRKINVVGGTLVGCGRLANPNTNYVVGIKEYDTVIIDEISKATPPELFIPASLGKKLILVGDHKQLPPILNLLSKDEDDYKPLEEWASELGVDGEELDVENTIFQRLWNRHRDDAYTRPVTVMLSEQYRMHPNIQALVEQFYTDTESGESMKCGLKEEDIAKLAINHDFFERKPAIWVSTKRSSEEKRINTSFYNIDEIEKVGILLEKLAELEDKSLSVGVITFYGEQLRRLRKKYSQDYSKEFGEGKLIFGTVDRFQGRECDVVICSLVRNNRSGYIGFAKKSNRINVAFSRARKALIILGSKEQFAYEAKNEEAKKIYKHVYDNCHKPKPKELSKT